MARSVKRNNQYEPNTTDLGYYRRTSLDDIINNFMIMYIGNDKVLRNVPRHEVAAVGQRAIQEFSYDVFHSEKNIELELNEARVVTLPADYVNYVEMKWVDQNGIDRIMYRSRRTRRDAGNGVLQDENYVPLTDENGDLLEAEESQQIMRYQDPALRDEALQLAQNYYYNYISCLLYTSPSPRDATLSRMPSSA